MDEVKLDFSNTENIMGALQPTGLDYWSSKSRVIKLRIKLWFSSI